MSGIKIFTVRKIYRVGNEQTLTIAAAFLSIFGIVFTAAPILNWVHLIRLPDAYGLETVMGFVAGLAICAWVWRILFRTTYEIWMTTGDRLIFKRILGTFAVPVGSVRRVNITGQRSLRGNIDKRKIEVLHQRGKMSFPWFNQAQELIADIKEINRKIKVDGDL